MGVEVVGLLLGRRGRGLGRLSRRLLGVFLRSGGVDRDMRRLGYIVRIRRVGICEVVVRNTVRFAVQSSNTGGLFLPVRPHIRIMVILVPPRTRLLLPRLCALLEELLIHILPSARYHTSPTQSRRPRRSTQRRTIRPLSSQYGRLVLIPIALAELEAAVLRPEEEPYSAEDETDAYQSE